MDITLLIIVIIAVIIVIACAWDINRVPTYKEEYDMNINTRTIKKTTPQREYHRFNNGWSVSLWWGQGSMGGECGLIEAAVRMPNGEMINLNTNEVGDVMGYMTRRDADLLVRVVSEFNNNKESNMRKHISTIIILAGIGTLIGSLWFGLDATEIPGAAKNLLYVSLSMVGMGVGGVITWVGAAYRER